MGEADRERERGGELSFLTPQRNIKSVFVERAGKDKNVESIDSVGYSRVF